MDKNVILDMALKLDDKDIANLCSTNKKFKEILCNSNIFWRKRLLQEYGINNSVNPKETYINIVENKRYCSQYSGNGTDTFILDVPLKLFSKGYKKDVIVFNFITDKIFASATDLPNYFITTYNNYIKNTEYASRIEQTRKFTESDYEVMVEFLEKFERYLRTQNDRDSLFMAGVLKGILENRIEFEVKIEDLCNYIIY